MTANQTNKGSAWEFDESSYADRVVAITGGAGFIGSHLARKLVALDARVRIIDDLSGGTLTNLADITSRIDFIQASILAPDALAKTLAGAEVVFHEAALASVPASIENPRAYHEVNINGTLEVLEAARSAEISRVVFASSSSVYGDQPTLPKFETDPPQPLSPYALQKLTGESLLEVWGRCYGLSPVALRYFNIFGPGQSPDSAYAAVVAAFADALLQGKSLRIFGDGKATRDFTFIDNVVQANLRAGAIPAEVLQNRLRDRPPIFNVACGVQTSVLELAEAMIQAVGAEVVPEYLEVRAGDVLHSVADIGRAREVLGFDPTVGLAEGLKPTLEWYRRQALA